VLLLCGAAALPAQTSRGAQPKPAQPSAARDKPVPFAVGESLTYDVSWSSFVVAGSANVRVVEKTLAAPTAYSIVVEGRPVPLVARLYNLYYKMETLVDSATLLSQRGSLYSEEGTGKTQDVTRFDRSARRAFFERKAEAVEKAEIPIPPDAQDGLAVLYAIRARPLKPGERFTIPVADSGGLYTIQVDVGAPEPVTVPVGQFTAWNLKVAIRDAGGQPVWRNNQAWISTDARRLPVKLQAELPVGHFVLVLKNADVRN
jgi:hypothetical protein